jgi:hypothetical protein
LCLADASWVISLSCARARIRSTSTFRNTNHKPWLKLWIRLYKQCSIHKNGDKNIWTFTPWFYMFWTWTYITNWTKELNKSSSTTTLTRSVTSILTILYQNKQYFNLLCHIQMDTNTNCYADAIENCCPGCKYYLVLNFKTKIRESITSSWGVTK